MSKVRYGAPPKLVDAFPTVDIDEVMHYLYMPVLMRKEHGDAQRVPSNVKLLQPLISSARSHAYRLTKRLYNYVYLSARKGWATPDNPLNRPGWHADGFGTTDLNYVWWTGPGTRFAEGDFGEVPNDHIKSLEYFTDVIDIKFNPGIRVIANYPQKTLFCIDPSVVHAAPVIQSACWRQYVKISFSDERYNLGNNSHNYMFDYDWPMHSREVVRNDPHKAQRDSA
jgi:hypothetical protein